MTVSVCLTFDFDGFSSWSGGVRRTRSPNLLARGEFGAVGAERLLDLLRDRQLPSTWFTPGHTIDTWPELCQRIADDGHELAYHGYCHEGPSSRREESEERAILERGIEEDPSRPRRPGEWVRPVSGHRHWISVDGSTGFRAEPGRYHLYVTNNCPWSHRCALVRSLLALTDVQAASRSLAEFLTGYDVWLTPVCARPAVPLHRRSCGPRSWPTTRPRAGRAATPPCTRRSTPRRRSGRRGG